MKTPTYNNNFITLELLCFIEGVEVPATNVAISYGIGGSPRLSLTIPASSAMRDLHGYTKLAVFFKDFIPDPATGKLEWRLLFDGEMADKSYSESPSGASLTFTGMHASGELDQMPIMVLPISSYMYSLTTHMSGQSTILSLPWGSSTYENKIVDMLTENKAKFESMADVVYALVKSIVSDTADAAVGIYFKDKMGTGPGGTKILSRFWDISPNTLSGYYHNDMRKKSYNGTTTPAGEGKITDNALALHNIKPSMFECPCGYADCAKTQHLGDGIDVRLIKVLDMLEAEFGKQVYINSGYRCEPHNRYLMSKGYNASPTSNHLFGRAADIHINEVGHTHVWAAAMRIQSAMNATGDTYVIVDKEGDYVGVHVGISG